MQSPFLVPLETESPASFQSFDDEFPQISLDEFLELESGNPELNTISQTVNNNFGYLPHTYQIDSLQWLLRGNDCILYAPTSAGKSLISQAYPLFSGGWCLVIVPLNQLGLEQQQKINRIPGLHAEFLHSDNNNPDLRQQIQAQISSDVLTHLLISPELVITQSINQALLQNEAVSSRLKLVAVDEVHLISQWGKGFRPAYHKLSWLKHRLPRRIPWFGASATLRTECLQEIQRLQIFSSTKIISVNIDRPTIYLEHQFFRSPQRAFTDLFFLLPRRCESGTTPETALQMIPRTVVFIGQINSILAARDILCRELSLRGFPAHLVARSIDFFFSYRSIASKTRLADELNNDLGQLRILLATDAIGMGMDFHIDRVVQWGSNQLNIDTLVQRFGRAGRRQGSKASFVWFTQKPSTQSVCSTSSGTGSSSSNLPQTKSKQRTRTRRQLRAVADQEEITQDQQEILNIISSPNCLRQNILSLYMPQSPQTQQPLSLPIRCCSRCHPELILYSDSAIKTSSARSTKLCSIEVMRSEVDAWEEWKKNPVPGFTVPEASSVIQVRFLDNLYTWAQEQSRITLRGAYLSVPSAPYMILSPSNMQTLARNCRGLLSPTALQVILPSWSWSRQSDFVTSIIRMAIEASDMVKTPYDESYHEAAMNRLVKLDLWKCLRKYPTSKGRDIQPGNKRLDQLRSSAGSLKRKLTPITGNQQHVSSCSSTSLTSPESSAPKRYRFIATTPSGIPKQYTSTLSQLCSTEDIVSSSPLPDSQQRAVSQDTWAPLMEFLPDTSLSTPAASTLLPLTRSQTSSSQIHVQVPDSQMSTLVEDSFLWSDDADREEFGQPVSSVSNQSTPQKPISQPVITQVSSTPISKQVRTSKTKRVTKGILQEKDLNVTIIPKVHTRSGRQSKPSQKIIDLKK